MASQTYQLPYDSEHDKDIYEWLNSLPRNRKGEIIRYALRYYMASIGEEVSSHWAIPSTQQVTKQTSEEVGKEEAKKEVKKKPSLPIDGEL